MKPLLKLSAVFFLFSVAQVSLAAPVLQVASGSYICTASSCPVFDYGAVADSGVDTSFVISNTGNAQAKNFAHSLSGSEVPGVFSVVSNNCGTVLNIGGSCTYVIRFKPLLADPAGAIYGNAAAKVKLALSARSTTSVNALFKGTKINKSFQIVDGNGSAIVPPFDYQYVEKDSESSHTFKIVNNGNVSVTPSLAIASGMAPFALGVDDCGTLAVGASCQVAVAYAPTNAGANLDNDSLSATDGAVVVSLSLRGRSFDSESFLVATVGTAFRYDEIVGSDSGSDHDFGSVNVVSGSKVVTFDVKNWGSVPTPAFAQVFSDPTSQFSVTANSCSGELDPGASCTYQVTFDPSSVGSFDDPDSKVVFDGGSGSNSVTIELKGAGVNVSEGDLVWNVTRNVGNGPNLIVDIQYDSVNARVYALATANGNTTCILYALNPADGSNVAGFNAGNPITPNTGLCKTMAIDSTGSLYVSGITSVRKYASTGAEIINQSWPVLQPTPGGFPDIKYDSSTDSIFITQIGTNKASGTSAIDCRIAKYSTAGTLSCSTRWENDSTNAAESYNGGENLYIDGTYVYHNYGSNSTNNYTRAYQKSNCNAGGAPSFSAGPFQAGYLNSNLDGGTIAGKTILFTRQITTGTTIRAFEVSGTTITEKTTAGNYCSLIAVSPPGGTAPNVMSVLTDSSNHVFVFGVDNVTDSKAFLTKWDATATSCVRDPGNNWSVSGTQYAVDQDISGSPNAFRDRFKVGSFGSDGYLYVGGYYNFNGNTTDNAFTFRKFKAP